MLLSKDSVLRKLPPEIDPKQALFIDGIRHAVEIIDLAYSRLRDTLTNIALADKDDLNIANCNTHAFLDAWAMVDAVDRFRGLCKCFPDTISSEKPENWINIETITQPFRNIRNVSDHLGQRAEFLVSRKSTALGTLTWFTGSSLQPPQGWFCTLKPGTIRVETPQPPKAMTMTVNWPTDTICLSAGGYDVELSSVLPQIALRVGQLESNVTASLKKFGKSKGVVASDMFLKFPLFMSIHSSE
jgi:hypothetical protein